MCSSRGSVKLAWLATLLLAVSGCLGGGAKPPAGGTSLTGTLRNEYGHPVGRATLKVGSVTATTDTDGAFRLSGLPSGSQTVVFRAQGYLDRDLAVTVKAGQVNQLTEPGSGGPVILRTVHSATGSLAGPGTATSAKATKAAKTMQASQTIQAMEAHTAACDTCHSVTAGVGAKFLDANSQSLCTQAGCHATAVEGGTFEHPAAHLDSTLLQPTGDLAEYDQISCLRCHVSHADTPGGSLTPGFPATVTNTAYVAYCSTCHNDTQPGNGYDPSTHNPGSDCTSTCHKPNGTAKGHNTCATENGACHVASANMVINPGHSALVEGCRSCHDTSGTLPNLLRSPLNGLCLGCHPAGSPKPPHNVYACSECHVVHSLNPGPTDFQCLMCHWGSLP